MLLYILDLKRPNLRQKIKISSASESEISFDSDDSDINFIPEVEIENARQRAAVRGYSVRQIEERVGVNKCILFYCCGRCKKQASMRSIKQRSCYSFWRLRDYNINTPASVIVVKNWNVA